MNGQPLTRYDVRATGIQPGDPPHAFNRIDVAHVVEGPMFLEAVPVA